MARLSVQSKVQIVTRHFLPRLNPCNPCFAFVLLAYPGRPRNKALETGLVVV